MAFSYTSIIYSDLAKHIYLLGKAMADERRVEISHSYNNGCRAVIHADRDYPVAIGFAKIGSPSYSCVCITYSYDCVCEHIVAAAFAYDRSRGVFFERLIDP